MPISISQNNIHRLGVMGGSFDPVHMAHLISAETVCEELALDLVLFVPVGQQPLKEGKPVASAEQRLAMVAGAIADNPRFALSRVDVDRPSPSYTVETLRQLRTEWGEQLKMWFIVGSDSLRTFAGWHDPEGILAQARLAVVKRPGVIVDFSAQVTAVPQLATSVDWVEAPLIDISATNLRRRVAERRSIRYRVPDSVRDYIEANGLYRR
ncbi:MAG: nicotinate-nucleotide adenylyltransferase [Chloroflexi bacterium]|nr:nicotinate-nucleotide adenylyltransferase [Chloroflexota bacterium]